MARHGLTDEQWEVLSVSFGQPAATGRPPRERREVFEGILWILRAGAPWRDLPEEFGPWQTVWRLFDEWNSDGTLEEAFRRLQRLCAEAGEISDELWCLDGTIVRAARCAAGGGKKRIRRSRAITH
jgi:transposase